MMEYEVKIRVGDLQPLRARLAALGNRPATRLTERDLYFNSPKRDFSRTDEALRIRSTEEDTSLTYKGPKIGLAGVKAREELIVSVDPKGAMEEILFRLGFTRTAMVEKTRETYRVEGTFVALDEVKGLGSFVEIEAPSGLGEDEAIALISRVRGELEVRGEETTLSYLEMILAKR
ncbi:MAG: class IV adenylate cyclase [Methanomicrobiales archaeon]|nr:class IV adenylate cyclase [Methanomicrobiales archaeon]